MENHQSLFFNDGKKTIDFVLVYNVSDIKDDRKVKLECYLNNLLRTGLDLELEPFMEQENVVFVKIHAPKDIVVSYSDVSDVDLTFTSKEYRPRPKPPFRFMATPLSIPNPEDPLYHRAPEAFSGSLPTDVTSAERIMVLYRILSRTKFGDENSDYGLEKLISLNIIVDAYPLHEGPFEWTESGSLSDRQLLAKYWGSPKCWYKEQPLNLIEKYYGTEVAFYFAWCDFYLKMLIPVALMSIVCIMYGLLTLNSPDNWETYEICRSEILMCPRCHYVHCKYEKLSNSCLHSNLNYIHDNYATMAFAIIISFWSTIFIEFWQRKEAVLQIQWNVKALEYDTSMRPEYVEAAPLTKYSPITREYEPYIPRSVRVARFTLTLASVVLMLLIMVFATFGVMVYQITVSLLLIRTSKDKLIQKNHSIIASTTGSVMSASIIIIFKMVYGYIAMWLTKLENHRTQHQFDNSYIYKSYALAFTNHYAAVFYIAFFKGRFYTHPGDLSLWSVFGGLGSDICDPTGCIVDLSLQMISIMIMKIFVNNCVQVIFPVMMGLARRFTHKIRSTELPLYAKEYLMPPTDRYFLIGEYMDMVIQYGYIIFFIAGFPPAPLLAALNNFVEIRVDSYKMTRSIRRPVPRRVTGLGAWYGILQGITYIGVATNAVVIAFSSDFVTRLLYTNQEESNKQGFINTTLSGEIMFRLKTKQK
ncbi:hypothetical protein NQ317_014380 [Molorchus minor]|uniref:Anoctamin n=1 Tax=Molorchus minor TaxID=1323400 RepID=A0ABQ9K5Z4_9CUCU|nr:hypothetical protein NQ317_014380 [Molorchus minor]